MSGTVFVEPYLALELRRGLKLGLARGLDRDACRLRLLVGQLDLTFLVRLLLTFLVLTLLGVTGLFGVFGFSAALVPLGHQDCAAREQPGQHDAGHRDALILGSCHGGDDVSR